MTTAVAPHDLRGVPRDAPRVRGLSVLIPPTVLVQDQVRDVFAAQPGLGRLAQRLVATSFGAAGVERRHTVLEELTVEPTGATTGEFYDRAAGELRSPGTAARNAIYAQHAGRLATATHSHCARFHHLVAAASGNRLLVELESSLSASIQHRGLQQQVDDALDVVLRIDEHDRILTALRGGDVGAAAHHTAVHGDAALRSLHHEPILTDLTTLVRGAAARGSA